MDEIKLKVPKKNIFIIMAIIILAIIVVGFLLYNRTIPNPFKSSTTPSTTSGKAISADLIEITASDCTDCYKITQVSDNFVKQNKITLKSTKSIDYKSDEGKSVITKYKVTKVPAFVVISSNINDLPTKEALTMEKDYAIFEKGVPYVDLSDSQVKGIVSMKEVYDPSCKDCVSLSPLKDQLEKLGIVVKDYQAVESTGQEGKNLIKDNNLQFLPSLIMSKDVKEYWWFFDKLKPSLTETQNYYVFNAPIPPYKDLGTGELKGAVEITYLNDKSCADCYDSKTLKKAFSSFGILIKSERSVDVSSSEGKALIDKYKITKVPTAILSKEISDYKSIKSVMDGMGTYESDGTFVYTNLDQLQVKYKTLS